MSLWHKDLKTEQILTSLKMTWEYRTNIPIDSILVKESKRNNARFTAPIDNEKILRYVQHMHNGDSFPAVVLTADHFILGGNHRIDSARQTCRTVVDAYVLTTDPTPQQLSEFIHLDNTRHGIDLTEEQAILAAVEKHRAFGIPLVELNLQYFGENKRTYDKMKMAKRAADISATLQSKGVDTSRMNLSCLDAMHPLADNINVLRDTGLVVAEYLPSSENVEKLVKMVREEKTEDAKITVIREYRDNLKRKLKTGKVLTQPTQFSKEIEKFTKFLKTGYNGKHFPPVKTLFGDTPTAKNLKKDLADLIHILKTLKDS